MIQFQNPIFSLGFGVWVMEGRGCGEAVRQATGEAMREVTSETLMELDVVVVREEEVVVEEERGGETRERNERRTQPLLLCTFLLQ